MAVSTNIVLSVIRFPFFFQAPWKAYFAGFSLPTVGITVGIVVSRIFRQDYKYARTVAIETAMQNFPLCIGVISLSFPRQHIPKLLLFPLVTGLGILCNCLALVIGYRIMKKCKDRKKSNKNRKCKIASEDEAKKEVEKELIVEPTEKVALNV